MPVIREVLVALRCNKTEALRAAVSDIRGKRRYGLGDEEP
jgi:hypothetical protein